MGLAVANALGFDPLAELRGLHMPEPVSWWPPAPGWWLVAVIVMIALVGLSIRIRRQLRSPLRAARAELVQLEAQHARQPDNRQTVGALSALLRRSALAQFPNAHAASLCGQGWLEFLDRTARTDQFSRGPGVVLTSAPYQPDGHADVDALFQLTRDWLAVAPRFREPDPC